ncbi:VanW family protein [Bacillus sp. AGMB 02131]|uniref:VanW family protein n=1 Tax=Peribacillus faecalis TaxID=2772559 RepID=A0A927CYZ6_9BACI|nr:VanW family protein [Peribacillus faecalis]MBD3108330.1 VanW family protein [Peribacillus faecalis]
MKKLYVWLIAIAATVSLALGSVYWYVHSTVQEYENTFYPNVTVEGVNISKLSKEEAQKRLSQVVEDYNQINIDIAAEGQVFKKQLQNLNVTYDLEEQLEAAYQFGKEESLLKKYKLIKDQEGQTYSVSYKVDDAALGTWITEIDKAVYKDPQNASLKIKNGQMNVTNDVKGSKLNQEQLKTAIIDLFSTNQKQDISIKAPIEAVPAKITAETLNKVNHKIGSFTTYFSGGQSNRNYNIKLATETIDSYLLMPGESFSFNNYVGDTTADKGYRPAGSFLDGEVVNSYGGGVCQVSTTLYNSIIKAGIVPDVRFNHSMRVYYVPIGQDAAIAYPYKDLAFTNPYDTPVYIEGSYNSGSVTFTVYSTADSKEAATDFQLKSSIVSSGAKTRSVTYLEKLNNGKVVDRKVISNDTYK